MRRRCEGSSPTTAWTSAWESPSTPSRWRERPASGDLSVRPPSPARPDRTRRRASAPLGLLVHDSNGFEVGPREGAAREHLDASRDLALLLEPGGGLLPQRRVAFE